MGDETRQDAPDPHAQEVGQDAVAQAGQDVEADQGISKEQDERYVIEHAKLLVRCKLRDDGGMTRDFRDALRDLRTAVAFLEAHGD